MTDVSGDARSRPHLEFFSAVIPAKAGIHFDFAAFAIERRSKMDYSPLLRAALRAIRHRRMFASASLPSQSGFRRNDGT
jgi:hypothetical protein